MLEKRSACGLVPVFPITPSPVRSYHSNSASSQSEIRGSRLVSDVEGPYSKLNVVIQIEPGSGRSTSNGIPASARVWGAEKEMEGSLQTLRSDSLKLRESCLMYLIDF